MNTSSVDTVARHAADVMARRGSFRLLGGAALAGVFTAPAVASAGKAGKQARKKCQQQRGQCRAYFADACASVEDPQACEALFASCCEHFAQCNAGQGIACVVSTVPSI